MWRSATFLLRSSPSVMRRSWVYLSAFLMFVLPVNGGIIPSSLSLKSNTINSSLTMRGGGDQGDTSRRGKGEAATTANSTKKKRKRRRKVAKDGTRDKGMADSITKDLKSTKSTKKRLKSALKTSPYSSTITSAGLPPNYPTASTYVRTVSSTAATKILPLPSSYSTASLPQPISRPAIIAAYLTPPVLLSTCLSILSIPALTLLSLGDRSSSTVTRAYLPLTLRLLSSHIIPPLLHLSSPSSLPHRPFPHTMVDTLSLTTSLPSLIMSHATLLSLHLSRHPNSIKPFVHVLPFFLLELLSLTTTAMDLLSVIGYSLAPKTALSKIQARLLQIPKSPLLPTMHYLFLLLSHASIVPSLLSLPYGVLRTFIYAMALWSLQRQSHELFVKAWKDFRSKDGK